MKLRFPTRTESLSDQLANAFEITLAKTDQIFELITDDAYWMRPIPLRHPINFYEGHLPAFIWNTVFRRTLNYPSFNPEFDRLFERGIDPKDQKEAEKLAITSWPSREEVQAYKEKVHEQLFELISDEKLLKNSKHSLMQNGAILWLALEHEMMHQETLLYMLHQLPNQYKACPPHYQRLFEQNGKFSKPQPRKVKIPAGIAHLGASDIAFDFTWDNECPEQTVEVHAFSIDALNVTNEEFLEFIEAGGYKNPTFWTLETWKWKTEQNRCHPFFWKKGLNNSWLLRDFFEEIPLPLANPVFVTHAEAEAFARWKGESLPTEAEWHRAAFGDGKACYPWGDATPTAEHGNFNFKYGSSVPVGQFPKGASRFGVYDLTGNGWEWTETAFAPFPDFTQSEGYPQYSIDFFDGQHYVVKGGSCFTDTRLLRRSFRNWFYWHYPYAYTTFRCVNRNA